MSARNPKDVDFSIDNPERFENDCECEISPVGLNGWNLKFCRVSSYVTRTDEHGNAKLGSKIITDNVQYRKRNMMISLKYVAGTGWKLSQSAVNQHGESVIAGPFIFDESELTKVSCELVKLMRV